MKGKFIVIDGIDGAGKSTAISAITDYLVEQGIPYVLTREPGGTPLAEEIREMALSSRGEKVDSNTELLLMFAARAQHISSLIVPSMESGKWVVCDRFTSTTKAYQGAARGLSMKHINMLETMVQGSFRPDMTFILDVDPETGRSRTNARGNENRLDKESIEFMSKARAGFLMQAKHDPERFRIVDASQTQDLVYSDLMNLVRALPSSTPDKDIDSPVLYL